MRPALFITVGIRLHHHLAEAGSAADDGFVDPFPELCRPHEGLVVETGAEQRRQQAVDRTHVEGKRRPAVLADGGQAGIKLCHGCADIRLVAGAGADRHQRIRLGRAGCHRAARAVIFKAAPHQHLVIGQQCRGDGIAIQPLETFAVEGEGQCMAAIDEAAGVETVGCHRATSAFFANSVASVTANTSWVRLSRSTTRKRRQPAAWCQYSW